MNPAKPLPDDRPATPCVVLDTNVVLDWLIFDDPSTRAFGQAIQSARLRWLVTAEFRDELAHVLARGLKTVPELDSASLWRYWDTLSVLTTAPAVNITGNVGPTSRYRCTDPDDQKFIDLAVACGARWLLSRDKAVLKLARQVKPLSLDIVTPRHWAAHQTGLDAGST